MATILDDLFRPQRARSTGRGTWLTVLGLVLIPVLVGGLLVWALWQPAARVDRLAGAVVNLDQPVQVDGKTVPLGRQLAAALVTGSVNLSGDAAVTTGAGAADVSGSASSSTLSWQITNAADAAAGLADGRYATVVTIPSTFSAAATSAGSGAAAAVQATVDIATSERSRPFDALVAKSVTATAVQMLSTQLTTTSLTSVFVGFDTLRSGLTDAASGATSLASGAGGVGDGAASLAAGASTLSSGVGQVASGASALSSGASSLASGVGQVASGASSLSTGVDRLASGATSLATGLGDLADQVGSSATAAQAGVAGVQQLADGLAQLNAGVNGPLPAGQVPLVTGAGQLAAGTAQLKTNLPTLLAQLDTYSQACAGGAGDPAACTALASVQGALTTSVTGLADGAAALDAGIQAPTVGLSDGTAALAAQGPTLVTQAQTSATGMATLAGYLAQSASGAQSLASGARSAASGAASLAAGASTAASGAGTLASGAGTLASGAQGAAGGASSLASGAGQLSSGAAKLSDGAGTLATGLSSAVDKVPSYTQDEAAKLAGVLADPVVAQGSTEPVLGSTSVPFLLVVALWLGGLATFLVLGATGPRVVGSTRSSLRLALAAFAPGALIGVVQGAALTAVMAPALDLTAGGWLAFGGIAALAAVASAAVNQGLVALLHGVGRFVSVAVAAVGLAAVLVSTAPPVLDTLFRATPLAPALDALQSVVIGGGGAGGGVAQLVVWACAGVALTTVAVARRRVVPAGQLARWVRAA